MESSQQVSLRFLHFNDSYEICNTPAFTATFLSSKDRFLRQETPGILESKALFRVSAELRFKHSEAPDYIPADSGATADRVFYQRTNDRCFKVFSGDIFFPSVVSISTRGKHFNKFLREVDCDVALLGRRFG